MVGTAKCHATTLVVLVLAFFLVALSGIGSGDNSTDPSSPSQHSASVHHNNADSNLVDESVPKNLQPFELPVGAFKAAVHSPPIDTTNAIRMVVPLATGQNHLSNITTTVYIAKDPAESLEFRVDSKPIIHFVRKKLRLPALPSPNTVRVACLYSGFLRDFQLMLATCTDALAKKKVHLCKRKRRLKVYGGQRRGVLDGTNCDVFISTWDLKGIGRFNKYVYPEKKVHPWSVMKEYRDQLAVLHMQNYSTYDVLWRYMHRFARKFPQTHPTKQLTKTLPDGREWPFAWEGVPETKEFLRLNDYSQSYKQWAVYRLVQQYEKQMANGNGYDVYFRLRTDLRSIKTFANFHWIDFSKREIGFDLVPPLAANKGATSSLGTEDHKDDKEEEADDLTAEKSGVKGLDDKDDEDGGLNQNITHHRVGPRRLFTNNFEVSDFGYLGVPSVIGKMANVWHFCYAPPKDNASDPHVSRVKHEWISEYNLMVWRIIFDEKWEIDSGGRALSVSRCDIRRKPKRKLSKAEAEHC